MKKELTVCPKCGIVTNQPKTHYYNVHGGGRRKVDPSIIAFEKADGIRKNMKQKADK